jgi:hypothetical protein
LPVKLDAQNRESLAMNTSERKNLLKGVGIVFLMFLGFYFFLTLFDRKHVGPAFEYTILYTTINGHLYQKEATAEDYNSSFVTFEDGIRVPWSEVKSQKAKFYPQEVFPQK